MTMRTIRDGTFSDRVVKENIGRAELTREIGNKYPAMTLSDIRLVVDSLFDIVTEAILNEKKIEIRGFGTFFAHRKPSRRGYIPSRGKVGNMDAMWQLKFRMGAVVKKLLMEKLEK